MRVAVIGVGDMGAEMIPHLVETDFEIVAYDKLPERLQLAKDAGAKVAGSVAEAATGADVVIQLTMSDDIPDVLLGEQGALAVVKPGAIVVVTSTTTPQMLNRVIEAAPAGVEVVDARSWVACATPARSRSPSCWAAASRLPPSSIRCCR